MYNFFSLINCHYSMAIQLVTNIDIHLRKDLVIMYITWMPKPLVWLLRPVNYDSDWINVGLAQSKPLFV